MSSSVRPTDRRLRSRSLLVLGGLTVAVATLALPASAAPHAASTGYTYAPTRLLDTRFAPSPGPVTGFTQVVVPAGTPSGSTVQLTVTAVSPAAGGYITAYSDDDQYPSTSNVDYSAGVTTSNTVLVLVPPSGDIDLNVVGGATNVIVDENGYFSSSALVGTTPLRLGDSRVSGDGFATVGVQSGVVSLAIPTASVPANSGLLALNVTAVPTTATTSGYLSVYGSAAPATSSLDYGNRVVSNMVYVLPVKTSTGYAVNFAVHGSPVDIIADLNAAAPSGSTFTAPTGFRLADSHRATSGVITLNVPTSQVPAGSSIAIDVISDAGVSAGYEVAYPTGVTKPGISNLQYAKGAVIAQTIVVPVSSSNQVSLYLSAATRVIVDVQAIVSPPAG